MARVNGIRFTRVGIVFIIGVIVLAVLVYFGIHAVQQRGEQVRRDAAAEIARQNQEDQQTPTLAADTPVQGPQNASQADTTPEDSATASPEALPQTGGESFVPVLLLALATYGMTLYVRSRRSTLAANR